jgi:hypothetical protein
MSSSR